MLLEALRQCVQLFDVRSELGHVSDGTDGGSEGDGEHSPGPLAYVPTCSEPTTDSTSRSTSAGPSLDHVPIAETTST